MDTSNDTFNWSWCSCFNFQYWSRLPRKSLFIDRLPSKIDLNSAKRLPPEMLPDGLSRILLRNASDWPPFTLVITSLGKLWICGGGPIPTMFKLSRLSHISDIWTTIHSGGSLESHVGYELLVKWKLWSGWQLALPSSTNSCTLAALGKLLFLDILSRWALAAACLKATQCASEICAKACWCFFSFSRFSAFRFCSSMGNSSVNQ